LYGAGWEGDTRWSVHPYSFDLSPFEARVEPATVRSELGIPPDALVIGHVGRFCEAKNHSFLIRIASEVAKREPRTRILLVGDGRLRADIEANIAQMGMADKVILTGLRTDVPRLLLGAVDVFVFPSLFEGLPLASIEAQAAGVGCVLSDSLPEEAEVVRPLVQRLSLSEPASRWAEAVLESRRRAAKVSQRDALSHLEKTLFNIDRSVQTIESVYDA
jgi:glycosyltransferase involved in cell wall biosynthesis